MTHNDIYTKFMIEYDKANVTSSYPALTKYEVATLLDRAYLTLIARKLTGNNTRRVPFEYDTKAIEDLRPLIVTSKFNSSTETTTVSNEYTFALPSNLMYYLEGVAEFGTEREVVQPINHQLARKFKATNSNIPWINSPVSYIEGSSIHVFVDPFEHKIGPEFDGTYIKKPASFVSSLTSTENNSGNGNNGDGNNPPDDSGNGNNEGDGGGSNPNDHDPNQGDSGNGGGQDDENTITVTFVLQNENPDIILKVEKDGTYTTPSAPTKLGFFFRGWTIDGEPYSNFPPNKELYVGDSDTTFIAEWSEGSSDDFIIYVTGDNNSSSPRCTMHAIVRNKKCEPWPYEWLRSDDNGNTWNVYRDGNLSTSIYYAVSIFNGSDGWNSVGHYFYPDPGLYHVKFVVYNYDKTQIKFLSDVLFVPASK